MNMMVFIEEGRWGMTIRCLVTIFIFLTRLFKY